MNDMNFPVYDWQMEARYKRRRLFGAVVSAALVVCAGWVAGTVASAREPRGLASNAAPPRREQPPVRVETPATSNTPAVRERAWVVVVVGDSVPTSWQDDLALTMPAGSTVVQAAYPGGEPCNYVHPERSIGQGSINSGVGDHAPDGAPWGDDWGTVDLAGLVRTWHPDVIVASSIPSDWRACTGWLYFPDQDPAYWERYRAAMVEVCQMAARCVLPVPYLPAPGQVSMREGRQWTFTFEQLRRWIAEQDAAGTAEACHTERVVEGPDGGYVRENHSGDGFHLTAEMERAVAVEVAACITGAGGPSGLH